MRLCLRIETKSKSALTCAFSAGLDTNSYKRVDSHIIVRNLAAPSYSAITLAARPVTRGDQGWRSPLENLSPSL